MRSILFIGVVFLVVSCKKAVLKVDPDYEGTWITALTENDCGRYNLVINSSGNARYYTSGNNIENVDITGRCKVSDKKIKIGTKNLDLDFPIIKGTDSLAFEMECGSGFQIETYSAKMRIDGRMFYKF